MAAKLRSRGLDKDGAKPLKYSGDEKEEEMKCLTYALTEWVCLSMMASGYILKK